MAFFRNEPITDVVHRLNLSADGEAGMTCWPPRAVTQARQRVGAAPVEWLFRQTAQTWGAERYLKDDWHERKRKLTAVCSHQTRIGNLDAHLI